ncbi:MAG: M28 family peptidase [bacterium]
MIKKVLIVAITLIIAFPLFAQDTLMQQSLRKHVDILASDTLEGRGEGSNGIKKARKYIITEFEKAGVKPYRGKYEYDFSFKSGAVRALSENIIACIEGSDSVLKNEYIVIGAHYDHMGWDEKDKKMIYYNGADDNASGTASIIEIAKLLNQNKNSLKRSIIIIGFGAEESGLIGSHHIFTDSIIPPSKIKCMFSIDMVGMYKSNDGLTLTGMETLKDYKQIIELTKQKTPILIKKTTSNIENRTDTRSFADEGIPSVHVFTGFKSHYHKPEDDSNLLDYEGMAVLDKFMYELVNVLANDVKIEPSSAFLAKAKTKGTFYFAPYITFGIGSSSNHYPDKFYNAKSIFAYNAGLAAKFSLSKNVAIQPEVWYESSGSKIESGTFRTNSLTIPVNILIGTDNSSDYNVFVILGGYLKNNLFGEEGGKSIDYSDGYNKLQYGLSFGFGFEIMNVQVKFIDLFNLTPLYSNPAMDKALEKSFFLNIGFKL